MAKNQLQRTLGPDFVLSTQDYAALFHLLFVLNIQDPATRRNTWLEDESTISACRLIEVLDKSD